VQENEKVMDRAIKFSFAAMGAFTGITLSRFFFEPRITDQLVIILVYFLLSASLGYIFYFSSTVVLEKTNYYFEKAEAYLSKMTLYELVLAAIGLIIGLLVANLIAIPINKIDVIGTPIAVFINIILGSVGIMLSQLKKNENIFESFRKKPLGKTSDILLCKPKVLDTSVIIDGRIADICKTGFLEGEIIVPSFVLEELRHIADSADPLKRNRGRRGLDVLNYMQKDMELPIRIEDIEIPADAEVDKELLKLTEKMDGIVLTIDYNLSKVAEFQKVPVLNVNDLANAMKPVALPGEEMVVQIIKDGKESDQGVGYLEDGTMIVVEGGRNHIGESLNVTVTSTLQTAAGRMVFARPKYKAESMI
jgi:uncharacterized protein YacL